jgi:NAD(P)H-dependent FMN reductase
MPAPKVLVIPGSTRPASANARLAALAAKELTLADAEVTRISLVDYPMPLYESETATPANALKLRRMIGAHHGVFLTTPELNASVPPVLVNTLAWVSRVRERTEAPQGIFHRRVFALGAATSDPYGGIRALTALRQLLEIGCGALVLPEQISVAMAEEAFDDMDNLIDPHSAALMQGMARRLVELSWERLGA